MRRCVYADETASVYINKLIRTGKWYIGIILGQVKATQVDLRFYFFSALVYAGIHNVVRKQTTWVIF